MKLLTRILFKIARSPVSSLFIGTAFEYLAPIIPLDRRYENKDVVVITHPRQFWKFHLVAIPKKRIPTFLHLSLDSAHVRRILLSTLEAIRTLAAQYALSESFMLINGGRYQDVPQIHFHLMSDPSRTRGWRSTANAAPAAGCTAVQRAGKVLAFPHPVSQRAFHHVVTTEEPVPSLCHLNFTDPDHTAALFDAFRLAQLVARTHVPEGYMFGTYLAADETDSRMAFHVFAGPTETSNETRGYSQARQ